MEPDRNYWEGKRVCVTGGTGLLGYQVVQALRAVGAEVLVLALPPRGQHPLLGDPGVQMVLGDIRDAVLVSRAVADRDVIFHLAGVVAVWGQAIQRMRDVHAMGTRNVLEAAPSSARVVLTSSVVTVGATEDGRSLDEESPFNLESLKIDYVHAKRSAERLALEHAGQGGDVVITNPGFLVGPEDFERSVMGRLAVRYWRGMIPVAPPGGVNLVDVRDVARGHLLAAEHGRAGRRYILGGENKSFGEFMADLATVAGLRPRATPTLPWWGLAALAGCSECRAFVTRRHPYPSMQHARLNRYYWFYRSSRAAQELGFAARPLGDSLVDTFRWFSARKRMMPKGASHWWMRPGRAA